MTCEGLASQDGPEPAATTHVAAGTLAHATATQQARQQAEDATTDPVYAELMGTYAELGDLLAVGPGNEWFEDDCKALLDRLVALGRQMDLNMAQALAAMFTRFNIERGAA